MMGKTWWAAAVLAVAVLSPAVVSAQSNRRSEVKPMKDIVTTAVEAGQFKTLAKALEAAGLVDVLKGPGPFTVFAPTDEAFAALPAGALDGLLHDRETLRSVLLYHVVPGDVPAKVAVTLTEAKTANGAMLTLRVVNGELHVDNAVVKQADIRASNGVIHVIDAVVLPKAAVPAGSN